MQQRGASLANAEAPPTSDGGAAHEEDEVQDGTPSYIRCLPKPLQFLFLISVVGFACISITGPFMLYVLLFVTPSMQRMLNEYEETGEITLGRVVDRTKYKWKFGTTSLERNVIIVEYNVGECTYRKKFGVTKAQYDDYNQYGMSSTVELLVLSGMPKSAMIKETIETLKTDHQKESWWCKPWQLILNVCMCILCPMFLTQIGATPGTPFFSWDGCILGLVLFVVGAWLFWWLDLVGKQERAFHDSAELVTGTEEDDDDEVATLPNESLTAPLLSAVTGF